MTPNTLAIPNLGLVGKILTTDLELALQNSPCFACILDTREKTDKEVGSGTNEVTPPAAPLANPM